MEEINKIMLCLTFKNNNSYFLSLGKFWEIVKDREAWPAAVQGVTKSWTQLSDWTTTTLQAVMT